MSVKPDEAALFAELRRLHCGPYRGGQVNVPFADAVALRLGVNSKRAHYLLEKWSARGWWNYGVSARSGWFEPEAPDTLT